MSYQDIKVTKIKEIPSHLSYQKIYDIILSGKPGVYHIPLPVEKVNSSRASVGFWRKRNKIKTKFKLKLSFTFPVGLYIEVL